jgi:hypothetical protein
MTNKTFSSITNKLIILLSLSLLFFPYHLAQAVPDPEGSPSLAWSIEPSGCEIWSNTFKIYGDYIYLACSDNILGSDYQIRIEKRNKTTGALVPEFGNAGIVLENPSNDYDYISSITLDTTGLYLGGSDVIPGNVEWRVEKRDLTTGALITGFGTNGVMTENPSNTTDHLNSITLDASGIYAGGYDSSSSSSWRVEKRDLTTGALIPTFGTNGIVNENISNSYSEIRSLVLDTAGLYLGGYDYSPGVSDSQWRVEKRDLTTGALITGFGTNGVVTVNPSNNQESIRSITIDTYGLYLGGDDYSTGNNQWRIEKRNLTTGALVTSFGTNGVITENPSSGHDYIEALTVNETGLFVTGEEYSLGASNDQWRLEKRDLTTGALDNSFATQGVLSVNLTNEYDELYALAIDETGIYLGGTSFDDDWTYHYGTIQKYAFPEDATPPVFTNLPGLTAPINITQGQSITTNPFIIQVKPIDNIEVARVEFYVDNNLICTDTTADSNGVYSCSWNTARYHSNIRVIAYDTTGNPSIALTRMVTVDPALYIMTLPETGSNKTNYLTTIINLIIKIL